MNLRSFGCGGGGSAPLPSNDTKFTMDYCFVKEGLSFRSHLPGYLRNLVTLRYQLVVPPCLRKLVVNAFGHSPAAGGQGAFEIVVDKS